MPFCTMMMLWSWFAFIVFQKVARIHLKLNFDLIHAHNLPDFLVFSALVPKLLGAKVVLHVQDVAPELVASKFNGRFKRILVLLAKLQEHLSTAFADHVLTVGLPMEQRLLKRGVPPKKLSIVLNSADPNMFPIEKRTEPFLREPTRDRPLILMFHGTLAYRSGVDIAIAALAKARTVAQHLCMRVMGAGASLLDLQEMTKRLGVADYVVFIPWRPIDAVADFIAEGDIGIIPYRSDGFMDLLLPTKAYEYALMRRPMIASDISGIRSMFRSGSTILCEPASVDSFADAIIDLYNHPRRRDELVTSAEIDNLDYRWEVSAEHYTDVLASLISRKRSRHTKRKNTSSAQ